MTDALIGVTGFLLGWMAGHAKADPRPVRSRLKIWK